MTEWRYWHKHLEWCQKCESNRAINRLGSCGAGHQIHPDSHQIAPVGDLFRRGGLSFPLNARSHAQAAKFLLRWNRQDSWRTIAQKLLRHRYVNYDNGRVDAVATMLAAYARRENERDEVCYLLGFEPPKTYAVAFHFRDESNAVALRQLFDRHGDTRREVGRKLLSGELQITEV